ncbi:hypothetical protein V6N13_030657 [Hibiscus sabdariffa]|uniref:Uncharacterized protein n=1 Tax=Hibiscus sabdariffa TaxID=183260 RepID=A0ABR2D5V5_9ROSI
MHWLPFLPCPNLTSILSSSPVCNCKLQSDHLLNLAILSWEAVPANQRSWSTLPPPLLRATLTEVRVGLRNLNRRRLKPRRPRLFLQRQTFLRRKTTLKPPTRIMKIRWRPPQNNRSRRLKWLSKNQMMFLQARKKKLKAMPLSPLFEP